MEASFVLRAPPNELQSLLCQEFGVSVTNVTRLFLKKCEGSLDFGQENKPRYAGADTGFQTRTRGSRYGPPKGFLCRGSGEFIRRKMFKLEVLGSGIAGILRSSQCFRISLSFFLI